MSIGKYILFSEPNSINQILQLLGTKCSLWLYYSSKLIYDAGNG